MRRDSQLDRIVAIKIPHHHAVASAVDRDRLEHKARVAAQLRHPGIVRLYKILTIEGFTVLVSDFIEGEPLKDVLERRRLTFRESAAWPPRLPRPWIMPTSGGSSTATSSPPTS